MAFCNMCGNSLTIGDKFCSKCGNKVDWDKKNIRTTVIPQHPDAKFGGIIHKCPRCGNDLSATDVICPHCGFEMQDVDTLKELKELTKKIEADPNQEAMYVSACPIPSSKQALLEFMMFMAPKAGSIFTGGSAGAYWNKTKELYQKAHMLMQSDDPVFKKIERLFNSAQNKRERGAAGLTCLIVIPSVILFIIIIIASLR